MRKLPSSKASLEIEFWLQIKILENVTDINIIKKAHACLLIIYSIAYMV